MENRNKSLLFLLRLWPFFGGGETVTICLANEFVKRGYNVHILYFKKTDSTNGLPVDYRIMAHRIEGIKCDELFVDEKAGPQVTQILIDYINSYRISIVVNQWWPVSYIKDIKEKTRAIVVKCNHTAFLRPSLRRNSLKGIVKRVFSGLYFKRVVRLSLKEVNDFRPYTDKYVFLSEGFVEQYLKYNYNENIGWVTSIPNPLVYNTNYSCGDLELKEPIVLFVGRIVDSIKRLSIALRAWSMIETVPELSDWRLVIVGDGPDKEKMNDLSDSLSLKRVSFEGFKKPESYYRRAKILVQTSRYEGFGMTILEAQQCGCVPLAMDTFLTVHDLIKSGENGLIVDDSQLSFNNGLLTLMSGDDERVRMAKSAIVSSSLFNIENIGNRWEHLFKDIMNSE